MSVSEDDRGQATAELALGLPSVVAVLLMTLWMLAAVTAQARCAEAARLGARAAARGEPEQVTRWWVAQAAPPGAVVSVDRSGAEVRVRVEVTVGGGGSYGGFVPAVGVSATGVAAVEAALGVVAGATSTTGRSAATADSGGPR